MKCFTFDPPFKSPPGVEFKVIFLHNSYCIRKTKFYQGDAIRGLNVKPWPSKTHLLNIIFKPFSVLQHCK